MTIGVKVLEQNGKVSFQKTARIVVATVVLFILGMTPTVIFAGGRTSGNKSHVVTSSTRVKNPEYFSSEKNKKDKSEETQKDIGDSVSGEVSGEDYDELKEADENKHEEDSSSGLQPKGSMPAPSSPVSLPGPGVSPPTEERVNPQPIRFKVNLDDSGYTVGEKSTATLSLINTGTDRASLIFPNNSFGFDIKVFKMGESNPIYQPPISYIQIVIPTSLEPGESVTRPFYFLLDEPGSYALIGTSLFYFGNGANLDAQRNSSDPIAFTVSP